MRHGKKISLVMPTLNEEENLPIVLKKLPKYIDEIIVVDAYSSDKTVEIAKNFNCKICYDKVIGKGSALNIGGNKSKGDYIIMMDADCSNRVEELESLIDGLEKGYDFCMGSRFMRGGKSEDITLVRKIGNKFFVFIVNLFFGSNYTDLCYGYRAMTKEAFKKMKLKTKGFAIETEMSIQAAKKKMRVLEVPSFEKKRNSGESRLKTFSDGFSILKIILSEMRRKNESPAA